jgi:hypothetical protein
VPTAAATVVVETDDPASTVAAILGSQLVPSAVDVLQPGRVAVLFEGGTAAVAAQVEAMRRLGGEPADASVWDESRSRQGAARGRARFVPGELRAFLGGVVEAVVRPASGVAYLPDQVEEATSPSVRLLQERVKERFDPQGVLA